MGSEVAVADQPDKTRGKGVRSASKKPTYVVSEQVWKRLKVLQAIERAVRMIHSVDKCPQCPTSFTELWKQAGEDQRYVANTMACLAASMVDQLAEGHTGCASDPTTPPDPRARSPRLQGHHPIRGLNRSILLPHRVHRPGVRCRQPSFVSAAP